MPTTVGTEKAAEAEAEAEAEAAAAISHPTPKCMHVLSIVPK